MPYLGEILSLSAAFTWAIATILFKKSGETVHPIGLNAFKSVLAVVLYFPTMYLVGEGPANADNRDLMILLASGALGIGMADTLFFMCLNKIGAGLTAVVDCSFSPFIIGLSYLMLGERLTWLQLGGVVLILSAIVTASGKKGRADVSGADLAAGAFYGISGLFLMSLGIVLVKPLLGRLPLIWTTQVRLFGGLAVLALVWALHPGRRQILASLATPKGRGYTLSGSFLGTYVAMLLWLGGMTYTTASVSGALNQTSTIFIFLLATWILKEPATLYKTLGIFLGFFGVVLVTFA